MYKERLDLSHQQLLREKLYSLQINLAEYTFANLYLFRHIHQYEVIFDDEIFIRGFTRDGLSFIMPTSLPTQPLLPLFQKHLKSVHFLFPIPEEWITVFIPLLSQASFKEEDSDYIFKTSKLATYPGRNLSKKRNLVKQLFSQHVVETKILTLDYKGEAFKILEEWQQGQLQEPENTDYFACQEAIEHLETLHLQGRLIYVDQIPAGLIIGEPLNDNCYVAHFSKASKHIKGLYQYLYQDLACSLADTFMWINLEQDLGSLTIRQAKHSYQPDRLIYKMRLQL